MKSLIYIILIFLFYACNYSSGTSSDVDIEVATLSGVVMDSFSCPVVGATVTLHDLNNSSPIDTITSKENGVYFFNDVTTGRYQITANVFDSISGTLSDITIDTLYDSVITVDTIWLVQPGVVSGTICNYEGGGLVMVYIPGTSFMTTVNDTGFYEMTGVAPGIYKITFERFGFSSINISDINVTSGDTTRLAPISLTPNLYPQNLKFLYDEERNTVTLSWDTMNRDDISGYIVSRKNAKKTAQRPEVCHDDIIIDTSFTDILKDELFSQSANDTIKLLYHVEGVIKTNQGLTGNSVPVIVTAVIHRDEADSQKIDIQLPSSNEVLLGLYPYEIQWEYTGKIKSVDIYFTVDGGASWNPICNKIGNVGSYVWKQVENVDSEKCQIKVVNSERETTLSLSSPFSILQTPIDNFITNGDFSDGLSDWVVDIQFYEDSVSATMAVEDGILHAVIDTVPENKNWTVGVYQNPKTSIYSKYKYEVSFKAKATQDWNFIFYFANITNYEYNGHYSVTVTNEWKEYRFLLAPLKDPKMDDLGLKFCMGDKTGEFWLDDVTIKHAGLSE